MTTETISSEFAETAPSKCVAIIPARGGSKRIPRKNIRHFRGKPILHWSIEAALSSGLFAEVMVSTEDEEIAEIAKQAGAVVPFYRSAETSSDFATTPAVLEEVVKAYSGIGKTFMTACCIYPTAPFVTAKDLKTGLTALTDGNFDVIMPVVAFDYPIWRSLKRDENGKILLNFPENANVRSQDLPPAYHDAGQFYWFNIQALLRTGHLMTDNAGSIQLPPTQVQDIDTEEDWRLAELKHESLFG